MLTTYMEKEKKRRVSLHARQHQPANIRLQLAEIYVGILLQYMKKYILIHASTANSKLTAS